MNDIIYLQQVILSNEYISLKFSHEIAYAWLENKNKHSPDIIELKKRNYIFSGRIIVKKGLEKITFKLSLSSEFEKIDYQISKKILIFNNTSYKIYTENNILYISYFDISKHEIPVLKHENTNFKIFHYKTSNIKPSKKTLDVIVIGSCFSRSVLKSDIFFNPNYKEYFNVRYTVFHNSFISLMSEPYKDINYSKYKDLQTPEVFRYIEIEFLKIFFDKINNIKPDLIFIDNYIDATRPIIQMSINSYFTYNKYFSESIYKRNFANKKIFYPGTTEHQLLYKDAIKRFSKELTKKNMNIEIVLLGGRLSKKKKNKKSQTINYWNDKMEWITKSNNNWNIVDRLFFEECKNAIYIDMRDSKWMSDISCPITGGASPSHYESEYYQDIFNKLKAIFFNKKE